MSTRTPSAFRLNLEQQRRRARELLTAAQAGDPRALARLARHCVRASGHAPGPSSLPWKLADAQLTIARELRFSGWARLKGHIASMDRQRAAMAAHGRPPDAGMRTLHLRCGSDIQETLREAGFAGDFLEHSVPYFMGPVLPGPARHEQMARFLVEAFPEARGGLVYAHELAGLREGEQALEHSAQYERVVLWMEHDPWDQLILARLLAHYEGSRRPAVLELIAVDEFPGGERFIGIGQLPPEALRALWAGRRPVSPAQLSLGREVWSALGADSPQHLAALARSGTPALPVMAPALRRHLQELPWTDTGLSLTERMTLDMLAKGSVTLNDVFLQLRRRDPLPSMTDLGLLHVVNEMLRAAQPPLARSGPSLEQRVFAQPLAITAAGAAVLRGERDWHDLIPPARWVGGVHVAPGTGTWRWHDARHEVVRQG